MNAVFVFRKSTTFFLLTAERETFLEPKLDPNQTRRSE
jgi:hypothetical protein